MSDCPTCGLPLVWSEDRERVWCAVYGDHREYRGRNVMLGAGPIGKVVQIEIERERRRSA